MVYCILRYYRKAATGLRGLLKSFVYAFNGIKNAVLTERNFRIHMTAIFFVLYFAALYGLNSMQYAVLYLVLALVPALELVNTAVEKSVDLSTEEHNELAKIAKDSSAAAVLVAAFGAIGVAVALFSDIEKLKVALSAVFSLPHLPILIIAVIFWIYFIFFFGKKR
ncbi:MAG: diacylglycerol kinase family protein [Ruminococcaceae bacterium]|nr:diacylglycerol kinase family protein [Oscillospiraceae bacterium]